MTELTWLVVGLLAAVALWSILRIFRRSKPSPQCPHCGSPKMVETERETKGTRTQEIVGGGAMAGGDVRLQLEQDVTYRCQSCGKRATFSVVATQ